MLPLARALVEARLEAGFDEETKVPHKTSRTTELARAFASTFEFAGAVEEEVGSAVAAAAGTSSAAMTEEARQALLASVEVFKAALGRSQ